MSKFAKKRSQDFMGEDHRHQHNGLCETTYSDGTICGNPGAISDSTLGGGPWKCRHHSAGRVGLAPVERRKQDWRDVLIEEVIKKISAEDVSQVSIKGEASKIVGSRK